jgi:sn-1 stearoyl-lipid 9-desaturase
MGFIDHILEPPSYGWETASGGLSKPTPGRIWAEFFSRLNIFKSRKNWLSFMSWAWLVCLTPFVFIFCRYYFSWPLLLLGLFYSLVIMGTHGTVWHHRFCTHKAYSFKNKWWRILTQHLVLKVIPEEIYVVSHHVHHAKSDQPGDPYNAQGGFLYCFLADANHQPISRNLSEPEYQRVRQMLLHSGIKTNSFRQYQYWGTVSHPLHTFFSIALNWIFWGLIFYLIGGLTLVSILFGSAFFWGLGIRTFNYQGHGKGHDKRKTGVDFNRDDMSINELRPGFLAGEWHNNHHLFPSSARAGFLWYQLDLAWCYIYALYLIGGVSAYHDSKAAFMEKYYRPFKEKR